MRFRPQRRTEHQGSLVAADDEVLSGLGQGPVSPLVSMLGLPAAAQIDVLNEDNAGGSITLPGALAGADRIRFAPDGRTAYVIDTDNGAVAQITLPDSSASTWMNFTGATIRVSISASAFRSFSLNAAQTSSCKVTASWPIFAEVRRPAWVTCTS